MRHRTGSIGWIVAVFASIGCAITTASAQSDVQSLVRQARDAAHAGNFSESLKYALSALEADKANVGAHYFASYACFRMGQYAEAKEYCESGQALRGTEFRDGLERLAEAIAKQPQFDKLVDQAEAAEKEGLFAKAATHYASAWQLIRQRGEIGVKAVRLLIDYGDLERCATIAREIPQFDKDPTTLSDLAILAETVRPRLEAEFRKRMSLGKSQAKNGEHAQAYQSFKGAAVLMDDQYEPELWMAMICVGRTPEENGTGVRPGSTEDQATALEIARKYVELGDFYAKNGRREDAATAYARAKEVAPAGVGVVATTESELAGGSQALALLHLLKAVKIGRVSGEALIASDALKLVSPKSLSRFFASEIVGAKLSDALGFEALSRLRRVSAEAASAFDLQDAARSDVLTGVEALLADARLSGEWSWIETPLHECKALVDRGECIAARARLQDVTQQFRKRLPGIEAGWRSNLEQVRGYLKTARADLARERQRKQPSRALIENYKNDIADWERHVAEDEAKVDRVANLQTKYATPQSWESR